MGSEVVIDHISERLGVKAGGTTEDGEFTLTPVECMGSCGTAPMMQVNDHYFENLNLGDVDQLLESLKGVEDMQDPSADPNLFCGPGSGPSRRLPLDAKGLQAGTGVVMPGGH
jgi:hypothetical protein